MNFVSDNQLYHFLKEPQIKLLDSGSQGQCYHDRSNNRVYKIFNGFFDVEDKIDYNAGVVIRKNIGDEIKEGDILASLYTNIENPTFNLDKAFEIS